jgi:SAM-dependent methyltransferase
MKLDIEELDKCPLCGGSEGLRDFLVTRDFETGTGEFPIQECTSCGLAFTNPRPTEQSLPLLYSGRDTSDFASGSRGIAQRLRDFSIRGYLRRRLPDREGGQLNVLDFGCGDGSLSLQAATSPSQPNVTSVDFHDQSPRLLAAPGVRATYQSYWNWRDTPGQYDVIFLRHVLEHHPEPTRLLHELFRSLKKGGTLHIEVPNRTSIWARLFGSYFFAYYVPRHLSHFNAISLHRAIRESGFALTDAGNGHTPLMGRSIGNVLSKDIDNLGLVGLALFPLQVLADVVFGRSTTLRASARK